MKTRDPKYYTYIVLLGIVSFLYGIYTSELYAGFHPFTGNENDFDAVVDYLDDYIDDYFTTLSENATLAQQRELHGVRKEVERLALKIDAGDIKNEKLREKVVSLRRQALRNRNSGRFIINNFDRKGKNRLGGRMGCEYEGEKPDISPWVSFAYEKERGRIGKKILQVQYDVREGVASIYHEIKQKYKLRLYNAIGFKIRGDIHSILVELIDENGAQATYLASDITPEWKTVSIGFDEFKNSETLSVPDIERITFSVREEYAEKRIGSYFLNDLFLGHVARKDKNTHTAVITYNAVEGTAPLGTNRSLFYKSIHEE